MQQYSLQPQKSGKHETRRKLSPLALGNIPLQSQPARISSQRADAVWDALMFYEEIAEDRPFLLRRFLPTPIGSQGCKSTSWRRRKMSICGRTLAQTSDSHSSKAELCVRDCRTKSRLARDQILGGDYTLRVMAKDRTRVALATHYASPNCPRWLFGRLEAAVCHSFHRYILSAMRSNL